MSYFLCAAGETLRDQIDHRWPKRDRASDGWIGDASHQAAPSDHNPDYSAGGVVRAVDVDEDLSKVDAEAMRTLADQLIRCAREREDNGRLSYVIYEGKIASGTYASSRWQWRTYTGTNPHDHHMHVSFTEKGDKLGGKFPLPVFTSAAKRRKRRTLRRQIENLAARIRALRVEREKKRRNLRDL